MIITGGDSGIGRAVAVQMAREGADITIVYLPQEQPDAEDTKEMVEKEGRGCLLVPYDLRNIKECSQIIDKHMNKYKKLDVLVNNASIQKMCKDFAEIDLGISHQVWVVCYLPLSPIDQVNSTFQSNIIQMFAMTKYALPYMKKGASYVSMAIVMPQYLLNCNQDHQYHICCGFPWHSRDGRLCFYQRRNRQLHQGSR